MIRAVAFFLAVLLVASSAGIASAQLDAPEGLFFADIPAEMKTLVEQLYKGPTPADQLEAMNQIAAKADGAAPAIPYLVQILGESIDPALRDAVVATLCKVGKPAAESVTACLKSERPETRLSAIEILETFGDKASADPLTNAALHDGNASIRDRALDALAHLAMTNPTIGDGFMATVEDESAKPEIRSRAMKAMGRLAGGGMSLDALVAMMENTEADIRLRCAAAAALGRTGQPSAVEPLVTALSDKTASMRVWAAVALNGNSAPEAVTALTKALEDENDRVRVRAADALAAVLDPKVIDPLVKATSDADADVRTWAVIGLGNYNDKKAVDALGMTIRDTDVGVRVAAADSLGRTGSPLASTSLIDRVNDFGEEIEVRIAAARALGALRDSRSVPTLLSLLNDNEPKLRQWVASSLGRIGDARAVEPLIKALSDSEPAVRGWAAVALSRFRDPRIIDPLINTLKDPEPEVRMRTVLALRVAAASPRVKTALEAMASDSDPKVQAKAKQVLAAK